LSSKTFVLDTNVLLHNAACIESFADNTVVLPMAVIEELDQFKKHNDELGRNARHVIRHLDTLRSQGNLRDGVPLPNGGSLRIAARQPEQNAHLRMHVPDNRILQVAYGLHEQGEQVIFVSKDINARVKADALGLTAMDFEKEKVNFDELYAGYAEVTVSRETVDSVSQNRVLKEAGIGQWPNQFVLLRDEQDESHTALARVVEPGHLRAVANRNGRVWNILPRNKEQRMALALLMDAEVQMVTLVGQAGTGKTLLALAAGLHKTLRDQAYDEILVSRPVIPLGKDIGYLPGDKEEKLSHWMQPIFDNLTYLMRETVDKTAKGKRKTKNTAQQRTEELLREHVLELEALTYIRGRSIPGQYVIVDEAQNLTPHEVKTIVSRAGEGTKIVLTGDPYQIDNPYLDSSSNGLTYAAERLKAQRIHGHVTLRKSERSALAAIAAEYL